MIYITVHIDENNNTHLIMTDPSPVVLTEGEILGANWVPDLPKGAAPELIVKFASNPPPGVSATP